MAPDIAKNILYGGPEAPIIDTESKSFGEVILRKLTAHGNNVLFVDGMTGEKTRADEVRKQSIRLAKSLQLKFGVKEGDVIGLCSENRLEFPVVVFAAFYLGATVAPLNVTYTKREFNHTINLSRPRIIFASPYVAEATIAVAKQNKFVQSVIVIGEDGSSSSEQGVDVTAWNDLNNSINIADCHSFDCKPIDMANNVALVLCSSGTTGLPKGVELTQRNILLATSQLNVMTEKITAVLDRLSILMVIPCFHAYGLLTMIGTSICGADIIFLPKFEEHAFLNAIQTHKPNTAFLVPPLFVFLAKSPIIESYDISSLVVLTCGAAPLSKDISDAVRERLNVFTIRQGYGMSEMTLSVLAQNELNETAGSVGVLQPGIYGKVIDTETGQPLGANQRGEMCFKGSAIMRGYINNKAETSATIDPDGWLHTGDIGYYDDNGEWFIVDRLKELIKYKGYQVPPAEIEAMLLKHEDIIDAAVIGIPDERAGELPFAFVVARKNSRLSQKDVIDYVASNASPAKRLHGGVQFIDAIPKNPTGKILRRVLREQITKKLKSKL